MYCGEWVEQSYPGHVSGQADLKLTVQPPTHGPTKTCPYWSAQIPGGRMDLHVLQAGGHRREALGHCAYCAGSADCGDLLLRFLAPRLAGSGKEAQGDGAEARGVQQEARFR